MAVILTDRCHSFRQNRCSMNREFTPPREPEESQTAAVPDDRSILNYLVYGLSLPERALRGTTAVVGGALRESAGYLVPQSFRDSRCYRTFVTQMLDFMAHDVGGVKNVSGSEDGEVEGYVARKAASQFVELAGLATLHVSPLLVLAIVSDVAYGSKTFLRELSQELKNEGVIPQNSTIDSTSELLDVIGELSGRTAGEIDLPRLSLTGLQQTIRETMETAGRADPVKLVPQAEIQRLWDDMRQLAAKEDASLLQVSGAMTLYTLNQVGSVVNGALTTVRVTGSLLDRHVIGHYRAAANEILSDGLFTVASRVSEPYVEALWYNFSSDRGTITADLLTGKMIGQAWQTARGWFQRKPVIGESVAGDPADTVSENATQHTTREIREHVAADGPPPDGTRPVENRPV